MGSKSEGINEHKVSDLMKNQKLFSNKELMHRNLSTLCANLTECEDYIQQVVDGKRQPDTEVAKALNHCISQFSTDDMALLEGMVKENFEDAVMVNTLAKLQHAHISLNEKLNNIFVQSVNKGPSKSHHMQVQQQQLAAATGQKLSQTQSSSS